jgi:hypothetical protein
VKLSRTLIAATIGAFYGWMAVNFWGGYAANNPINEWLLDVLAGPGHQIPYLVAISMHDVIVNVLLASPIATVLVAFRGLNSWPNLLVTLTFAVVISFWGTNWSSVSRLLSSQGFWLGLGMSIWSLPIAFAGIRGLTRSRASAA